MACTIHEVVSDVLRSAGGLTTRQPALSTPITLSQSVLEQKCILLFSGLGVADCAEDGVFVSEIIGDILAVNGNIFPTFSITYPPTNGDFPIGVPNSNDFRLTTLTMPQLIGFSFVQLTTLEF